MSRRPDAGFTLMELLIALVIFALVLLILRQGFDAATRVFERQHMRLSGQMDLVAVDHAIRRLIARADPGSDRQGPFFIGRAHGLVWRAPMPRAFDRRNEVQADMRLSVDGMHRFVMIWTPYRHVTEPEPPYQTQILLDGITDIDCSYYADGQWTTTWQKNRLPQLVRLRLEFGQDDPRHWPDIIVAPSLDSMP